MVDFGLGRGSVAEGNAFGHVMDVHFPSHEGRFVKSIDDLHRLAAFQARQHRVASGIERLQHMPVVRQVAKTIDIRRIGDEAGISSSSGRGSAKFQVTGMFTENPPMTTEAFSPSKEMLPSRSLGRVAVVASTTPRAPDLNFSTATPVSSASISTSRVET